MAAVEYCSMVSSWIGVEPYPNFLDVDLGLVSS